MYLQTGVIEFAPMTSLFFPFVKPDEDDSDKSTFATRWFTARAEQREFLHEHTSGDVAPPSPKSIYRLADKMGLDELKCKAKEAYLELMQPVVSSHVGRGEMYSWLMTI